jgi:hypothetical protein
MMMPINTARAASDTGNLRIARYNVAAPNITHKIAPVKSGNRAKGAINKEKLGP